MQIIKSKYTSEELKMFCEDMKTRINKNAERNILMLPILFFSVYEILLFVIFLTGTKKIILVHPVIGLICIAIILLLMLYGFSIFYKAQVFVEYHYEQKGFVTKSKYQDFYNYYCFVKSGEELEETFIKYPDMQCYYSDGSLRLFLPSNTKLLTEWPEKGFRYGFNNNTFSVRYLPFVIEDKFDFTIFDDTIEKIIITTSKTDTKKADNWIGR